jgi:hypothetical protein
LAQVSKIGFVILVKVRASRRFHFAKSIFSGLRSFWQSQALKISYIFFSEVSASLGQVFSSGLFFSGKVIFSQSQFSAKVSASPRLWRSWNSKLVSLAKSGL